MGSGSAEEEIVDEAETASHPEHHELEGTNRKHKKALALQRKYEEYKLRVPYPELLELEDASAPDVMLLNLLKATPNSVAVPEHWNSKREYLCARSVYHKKPYSIPSAVLRTGICEVRRLYRDTKAGAPLKTRLKQKLNPKLDPKEVECRDLELGCFSPLLTRFGELYYENKYQNDVLSEIRPGVLSAELAAALDIAPNEPAPWLYGMQRYGPPPAYPDLKVRGVNAPIPAGTKFGFGKGGWGQPQTNSSNQPVYPEVYAQDADSGTVRNDGFFRPRDLLVVACEEKRQGRRRIFDKTLGSFVDV